MDQDEFEGEEPRDDEIVDRPSLEEIRAAAEIVIFLENEFGVDARRLRVRVRNGVVFLQGSVASREQRIDIEKSLPERPDVKGLESWLTVREDE